MNILCSIIVAFSINKTQIRLENLNVLGKIVNESELYYFVDFSKEAKRLKFYGDYSERAVSKEDCKRL